MKMNNRNRHEDLARRDTTPDADQQIVKLIAG